VDFGFDFGIDVPGDRLAVDERELWSSDLD